MNRFINDKPERAAFFHIEPTAEDPLKPVTVPCFSLPLSGSDTRIVGAWSGTAKGFPEPPPIGSKVRVSMNGLGTGTVEGYFVEAGWIGLHVLPDEGQKPQWWIEQHAGSGRTGYTVFGAEIAPV